MIVSRAVFALVAAGVLAPGQDATAWRKMVEQSKLTLSEALERGCQEAGTGVAFHAELERDGAAVVYSIDVAQGSKTCNVVLGSRDGKVVEKVIEDEDHSALVQSAGIALAAAIETAVKAQAGTPIEAYLRAAGGRPVITVKVLGERGVVAVAVDGVSGQVRAPAAQPDAAPELPFTDAFRVESSEWSATGANPYFSLEPGTVLVLEGWEDGKAAKLTVSVLNETRRVDGVETRVVEEREELGGELIEVSRNLFAISKRTNSVYYFGEEVDLYKDGVVAGHEGAWMAGENGARFGLMLPGTPLLGARYYQEVAPGVAMDRAEIVDLAAVQETPAGRFEGCLKVEETTPLEQGREHKVYAWGVGLVRDGDLRLSKVGRAAK